VVDADVGVAVWINPPTTEGIDNQDSDLSSSLPASHTASDKMTINLH
jgi:hypothetical protein